MPNAAYIQKERQGAIAWAKQAIREKLVIIDFETTGFAGSEIVQIGVIDTDGSILMDTFVKPQGKIPTRTTQVHGITDAMVADAPSLPDVWDDLVAILRGRHAVAYNVSFEQGIIKGEAARHQRPIIRPGRWSCAMKNYARFKGDWNIKHNNFRWHSLSNAVMQQGITVVDAHSAIGDCRMTLALVEQMAVAE